MKPLMATGRDEFNILDDSCGSFCYFSFYVPSDLFLDAMHGRGSFLKDIIDIVLAELGLLVGVSSAFICIKSDHLDRREN